MYSNRLPYVRPLSTNPPSAPWNVSVRIWFSSDARVPVHRSAWISLHACVRVYKTDDCQKYVRACSWNDMEISRRLDVVKYRLAPLVFSSLVLNVLFLSFFFSFLWFFSLSSCNYVNAVSMREMIISSFFFYWITNWIVSLDQEWNRKDSMCISWCSSF